LGIGSLGDPIVAAVLDDEHALVAVAVG